MDQKEQEPIFSQDQTEPCNQPEKKSRKPIAVSLSMTSAIVCFAVLLSVILTFTFTAASFRSFYTKRLLEQQEIINADSDFDQLELMAELIKRYSYYAGEVDEETLLTAVLKAYASATGDDYAEYYTEEEYSAMTAENAGDHKGIGISIIQTTRNVNGYDYPVLEIIAIYQNSTASQTELQVGDCIYAVKDGEAYRTISEVGGFTKALAMLKGEADTYAEFAVFRVENGAYRSIPFSIIRGSFESESVSYKLSEADPSVGVVRISNFDLTTPGQLKNAVRALQGQNVNKFVFDVRNNPGGDLNSIRTVLTYFLQKGDLILSSIDKNGTVARSYYAEAAEYKGEYASCNVSAEEIGMFADLNMVVLCNGNTASAAEVFTATLRDFGLAEIVGETTFGKGIMQSFLPLSAFGDYTGYIKMTTYAYVTECGVTYHDIGISPKPECTVVLSEEAKKYNFYVLPQALDDQLALALTKFQ